MALAETSEQLLDCLRGARRALEEDDADRAVEQLQRLVDEGVESEGLNSQIEVLERSEADDEVRGDVRKWLTNVVGQVENWDLDVEAALEAAPTPAPLEVGDADSASEDDEEGEVEETADASESRETDGEGRERLSTPKARGESGQELEAVEGTGTGDDDSEVPSPADGGFLSEGESAPSDFEFDDVPLTGVDVSVVEEQGQSEHDDTGEASDDFEDAEIEKGATEASSSGEESSSDVSFDSLEAASEPGPAEQNEFEEDDETVRLDVEEQKIPDFGEEPSESDDEQEGDETAAPFVGSASGADDVEAGEEPVEEDPWGEDEGAEDDGVSKTRMGLGGPDGDSLPEMDGNSGGEDEDFDLGLENDNDDDSAAVSLDPEPDADDNDEDEHEGGEAEEDIELGLDNPGAEDSAGVDLDPSTEESEAGWEEVAADADDGGEGELQSGWGAEEPTSASDGDGGETGSSTFYGMPTGENETPDEGDEDDETSESSTFYGMPTGKQDADEVEEAASASEPESSEPTSSEGDAEGEAFSLGELEEGAKSGEGGSDPFDFDFEDEQEQPGEAASRDSDESSVDEAEAVEDAEEDVGARYSVSDQESGESQPRFEEPSVEESVSDPNETPQPEDEPVDDERFFELAEELAGDQSAKDTADGPLAEAERKAKEQQRERAETEEAPNLDSPDPDAAQPFQQNEKTDEARPIDEQTGTTGDAAGDESREREPTREAPSVEETDGGDRQRQSTAEAGEASLKNTSEGPGGDVGAESTSPPPTSGESAKETSSGAGVVNAPSEPREDQSGVDSGSDQEALANFVREEDAQEDESDIDATSKKLLSEARELLEAGEPESAKDLAKSVLTREPDFERAEELLERIEDELEASEPEGPEDRIGDLDQRPSRELAMDEVADRDLDHRFGFVLSLVDGSVTFEDILDLSSMPREETLDVLADMLDRGLISVD